MVAKDGAVQPEGQVNSKLMFYPWRREGAYGWPQEQRTGGTGLSASRHGPDCIKLRRT